MLSEGREDVVEVTHPAPIWLVTCSLCDVHKSLSFSQFLFLYL